MPQSPNRFPSKLLGVFLFFIHTIIASSQAYSQSSPQAHYQGLNNELKNHPAPYLALHGDDPVQWQEWNEETIQYARDNNKVLFLSIGYFACHWCHVMQQESYQDPKIAAIINENFVAVKVDRELNPALDRRLMDFTQRILGRGGWPLNVFITPDGYPIYSLLYAPPTQFLTTIDRLTSLWDADSQKVLDVVRNETIHTFPDTDPTIDGLATSGLFDYAVDKIMARADTLSGGFGQQQKFPSTPQLKYLLDRFSMTQNEEVGEFLVSTLDSMANIGLHDQLIGGFFRYSVNPSWELPHFEKMLYDNANLATLYMEAASVFGEITQDSQKQYRIKAEHYKHIALSTLEFMKAEMWHEDGALVAAFSAVDDDSVEGGSYLWMPDEISALLNPKEAQLIFSIWGLDYPTELAAGNHPRYLQSLAEYADVHNLNLSEVASTFEAAKTKMIIARKKRSLPVDDKLLAGWNALALSTFIQAAQQFPNQGYDKVAESLRGFLVTQLWDGTSLHRARAKGKRIGIASLEDYAYVAKALLEWALFTDNEADLQIVNQLVKQGWQRFHKDNGWFEGDSTLLAATSGSQIIADSANASPSSILILVTLKIAKITGNIDLKNMALSALNRGESDLTVAPFWYVSQLTALSEAVKK